VKDDENQSNKAARRREHNLQNPLNNIVQQDAKYNTTSYFFVRITSPNSYQKLLSPVSLFVIGHNSKSKLLYDWRSISQYVLVSSTLVGLAIRYFFLSKCCCLKFSVLFLWGALSDERTGLQFVV
jgi:hypothetical protein